jgi:hypothetical protein
MPKSRRRLKTRRARIFVAVLIVACLSVILLALLSLNRTIAYLSDHGSVIVASCCLYLNVRYPGTTPECVQWWSNEHRPGDVPIHWMPTCMVLWSPGGSPVLFIGIPLWIILALLAVICAFYWRRRRGFGPACCGQCGYDLTGNVSGVCPECGGRYDSQVNHRRFDLLRFSDAGYRDRESLAGI